MEQAANNRVVGSDVQNMLTGLDALEAAADDHGIVVELHHVIVRGTGALEVTVHQYAIVVEDNALGIVVAPGIENLALHKHLIIG